MRALVAGPGGLWTLLGTASWGLAAALVLARAAEERLWWACLVAVPLGLPLATLALIPAFAWLAPPAAPVAAALAGLLAFARAWWLVWTPRRRPPQAEGGAMTTLPRRAPLLVDWLLVAAAGALASFVAAGAARLSHAVLLDTPLAPIMGEPSTGDMGLHALRVAMIARQGVPPPSPLDPDYPLQYRYAFHLLAAAVAAGGSTDTAAATAAVGGLVVGGLVLAGVSLGWLWTRSWPAALAAGLLAALYGPSYWLPAALRLLAGGCWPGLSELNASMGGAWSLSPLTPSFPSILSAQESSPGIPMAALAWLAVLCCSAALVRAHGRRRAAASALLGVYLAVLAFAADFFLPLALVALAAGAAMAAWPRRSRAGRPDEGRTTNVEESSWPVVLRPSGALRAGSSSFVLPLVAGLLFALLLAFGVTGQVGGAGAARDVRLVWNTAAGTTPVYGGNHALLAGGEARALPNWVAVHDWGLLFWPGAILALAGAVRQRDPALLAAALAAGGTALFWQCCTVTYEASTPTDFRVQMYRYASLATACLAPLLPVGLHACLRTTKDEESALSAAKGRRTNGCRRSFDSSVVPGLSSIVWAAGLCVLVLAGGGAGLYLLAGTAQLQPAPPDALAGDAALARALAQQPAERDVYRLAFLDGPDSFLGMYGERGGYVPLWWALGGAAVPVGWDFGHPERYQPLYHHVVAEYDPAAAATLGLTHVALAPGQLPPPARAGVDAFLAACHAELVAEWGPAQAPASRRLYRIDAALCRAAAQEEAGRSGDETGAGDTQGK